MENGGGMERVLLYRRRDTREGEKERKRER